MIKTLQEAVVAYFEAICLYILGQTHINHADHRMMTVSRPRLEPMNSYTRSRSVTPWAATIRHGHVEET
jgi:hypothetical protein